MVFPSTLRWLLDPDEMAFCVFLFFFFLVAVFFDFLFVYSAHQGTIQQLFSTFSLKMGLTVPFTHLKNYFAIMFSVFNFQFSTVSKRILRWLDLGFQVARNGEA